MERRILLGSIIAVAILVLVSFTGVVGYQTTKSSTNARTSPLFSVRSSRAIDEESKDLTCDYVGKDEESVLSIPKRNDKTALNRKVIDIICAMDDITFNRFMNLVINKIQQSSELKDVNINGFINTIYKLRNNPDRINSNVYKNGNITWRYEFYPTFCWLPFCVPFGIFITIYVIINLVYFYMFLMTNIPICYTLVSHPPTWDC